jgi:hypothetical protein
MKKIVFIALNIIPLLLQAQDSITYVNGKCLSNNCINGYGVYEFNNGDKYEGNFSYGVMNGRGKYDYANPKASYNGLWVEGKREDNNATFICEQYKYVGSYKNDRQNGQATITFLTGNRAGDIFTGKIVNNKFYNGTYTYGNNSTRKQYTGEFTSNNNKFNGQGTLSYKNGEEQKGQWEDDVFLGKQIGILYKQPVYWDMLNKVTTSKDAFDIEKENKYCCITEVSSSGSITSDIQHIDEFKYFYIKKENGEVIAVVEIHDKYLGVKKGEVILNTDEKLLKHLNRNQYNKPAKGTLTHIQAEFYHDEHNCIWTLFPEKYSVYHNPKDRWENLKFVRPEFSGNGSYETILKVDESVIAALKRDEYPYNITGDMVLTGEYQQTYNFAHCEATWNLPKLAKTFWEHSTEDVQLHNRGWVYYAEFPQTPSEKPNPEEKQLFQDCSFEIKQLNEYAKNAPVGTSIDVSRTHSAITSVESVANLINETCDETLSDHLKEYPLNLFNLLANQTPTRQSPERSMNENIENAILRIMQHIPHESHIDFFNLLAQNNNNLLKNLITNMDDKTARLIGKNNYTSFIKELIRIYNAAPEYWIEKISKIEDEKLFGHIINLYPKPFKSDYKPSISSFGSVESLNEYRFDAEYNKNTGKIIVSEKELLNSQTYAKDGGVIKSRMWITRNVSTLNPLDPLIILTNKELPIVEIALKGGRMSDNIYLVPAIFFEYKKQKEFNQFLRDVGGVTFDVVTIYLSGGAALSSKIHWVVRLKALADIIGDLGDIANRVGAVKNEKVKQAIVVYNDFFLGLSAAEKVISISEFAKKLPDHIKTIIKDDNSLLSTLQQSYSSWEIIIEQLNKDNITENERNILRECYDNYLKLGANVTDKQSLKIKQILEIAVNKDISN